MLDFAGDGALTEAAETLGEATATLAPRRGKGMGKGMGLFRVAHH